MKNSNITSLDQLPRELHLGIFTLLRPKDLGAVCLVNRTLRAAAEPCLYATVEWEWMYDWVPNVIPPFTRFLRSIFGRPELGKHVRRLNCYGLSSYGPALRSRRPPKIPVDETVADDAAALIAELHVPFAELWEQELRVGTMDAYIGLLLLQLPRLTRLSMHPNFAKESRILGMVLRSSLCSNQSTSIPPALQQIRDVSFVNYIDSAEANIHQVIQNTGDVSTFFYLPNLESLEISIHNTREFAWPCEPPRPSKLTSLNLSGIREGCLGHILEVTKSLTMLHWQWIYNEGYTGPLNSSTMNFDKIFADLTHVRDTLTELIIEAENVGRFGPASLETQGSRCHLRRFSNLKALNCPQFFLLGKLGSRTHRLADVLPINLEHLTINDDMNLMLEMEHHDKALLQALQDWLRFPKLTAPNIRSFRLQLRESDEAWGPDMRQQLRAICATAGVEVEISKSFDDLIPAPSEEQLSVSPSIWEYQWL